MTSMHLYAELLLNIRSITFFASLQTEHNHETRVELSADNETIALSHEGSQASIRLPTKVAGGGAATLTLPPAPSKDITLRLQLEEKEDGLLRIADQESGNITPWAADTLSENATLSCCTCTQPFLLPRRVSTWKDLPSENWAEMMDFWHCHKPNQPVSDSNGNSTSTKGYSASNKLRAIAGIGFVDITQFLLAAGDCIGIEQNEFRDDSSSSLSRSPLSCTFCQTVVGHVDSHTEGWRIYKWAVNLAQSELQQRIAYPVENWAASRILTCVENESVRHFHLFGEPRRSSPFSMLLWVFTPDLSFSSSKKPELRHDPTRAVKVMWQIKDSDAGQGQLASSKFEEVMFPAHVVSVIKHALESSQELMPESSRSFNGWNVGLLQRFGHL